MAELLRLWAFNSTTHLGLVSTECIAQAYILKGGMAGYASC